MQAWNDFFAAEAGAAAALAGLLFVAVSINLARILKYKQLPIRAAEALLAFLSVLAVASMCLIPGQQPATYGLEIGGTGLFVWAVQSVALYRTTRTGYKHRKFTMRILTNQLPPLPFIVAGALLLEGRMEGLYWTVPGVLLSFCAGVFGAWVLLIEIQR